MHSRQRTRQQAARWLLAPHDAALLLPRPRAPASLPSSNDAGDQERRRLGDLIYAYSRQHPGKVRCLHWGVSWSGAQKGTYLEVDRLHMSPAGYHEMGDQVRWGEAVRCERLSCGLVVQACREGL